MFEKYNLPKDMTVRDFGLILMDWHRHNEHQERQYWEKQYQPGYRQKLESELKKRNLLKN